MNIFLNLDGTARKVTPERVFRGSNNVTAIDVFAPFPQTTALEIAFTLPDGSSSAYAPMHYVFDGTLSIVAGVWEYLLPASITAQTGDVYISINAIPTRGNQTSYQCRFTVEQSVIPSLPPEPEPDVYDLIIKYLQENNYAIVAINAEQDVQNERITQLENSTVRKVLVDFTVNPVSGVGTKYYSDGTTATVQFPIGKPSGTVNNIVSTIDFQTSSFVDGEVAFSPMQTGQRDNRYIAALDKNASATYETGQEETPTMHKGTLQTANAVFKGSDGSLLLSGFNVPFDGRLVILGGWILSGNMVVDVTVNRAANVINISYVDGTTRSEALPDGVKSIALDGRSLRISMQDGTLNSITLPNDVSDVDYDAVNFRLEITYGDETRKILQLPRPTEAQRYIGDYTVADWQGAEAPYSLTIAETTHQKGVNPLANSYGQVFGVSVAANGDITLTSPIKKAFKIIII